MSEMPKTCEHAWIVSAYGFFKETTSSSVAGPTICKDVGIYRTSVTRIDIVEADSRTAVGMRARELMCVHCGLQRALPWPDARTEASLEAAGKR